MSNMDANLLNQDNLPFRVGIYAVEGFALMSYACTVEPLRAANLLAKRAIRCKIQMRSTSCSLLRGAIPSHLMMRRCLSG